jgi:hypothetical protein
MKAEDLDSWAHADIRRQYVMGRHVEVVDDFGTSREMSCMKGCSVDGRCLEAEDHEAEPQGLLPKGTRNDGVGDGMKAAVVEADYDENFLNRHFPRVRYNLCFDAWEEVHDRIRHDAHLQHIRQMIDYGSLGHLDTAEGACDHPGESLQQLEEALLPYCSFQEYYTHY